MYFSVQDNLEPFICLFRIKQKGKAADSAHITVYIPSWLGKGEFFIDKDNQVKAANRKTLKNNILQSKSGKDGHSDGWFTVKKTIVILKN